MKITSLNLQCGMQSAKLLRYLASMAIVTDIFCFQEVAGGYRYKLQYQQDHFIKNNFLDIDLFEEISKVLSKTHFGLLSKSYFDNKKSNYVGNALFIKKNYTIKKYREIYMGDNFLIIDISEKDHTQVRYTAQAVEVNGVLTVVNTHMLKEGVNNKLAEKYFKVIKKEIKSVSSPILLTGDFNVDKSHKFINKYFSDHNSLNEEFNIKNTLNPSQHILFKKDATHKGLSVDQFLVKRLCSPVKMKVEKVSVSDHYPITCIISKNE